MVKIVLMDTRFICNEQTIHEKLLDLKRDFGSNNSKKIFLHISLRFTWHSLLVGTFVLNHEDVSNVSVLFWHRCD
jgi:hypothetical protein